MDFSKTIAAVSTPRGVGGIAIIRMSGKDAVAICDKVYKGKQKLCDVKSHTINYGHIIDENQKPLDEVMVSVMRAPHTYTKEDVVEINCHGSVFGAEKILEILLKNGAYLAEAGEFTKRAFLNGRIDLCEAEAVIDIINSKTDLAHTVSVNQLGGALSEKINEIRNDLLSLIANLCASLDFPEEGLEPLSQEEFFDLLKNAAKKTENLIAGANNGKVIRDGISTAIVGKPNVGKSSLLNLMCGDERAIVTEIEGTTRDLIEEYVSIGDVTLKLCDTAGIRQTGDVIEAMGVEKSKKLISDSQLVIFMLDSSRSEDENDREIANLLKGKNTIVLLNKTDKAKNDSMQKFASGFENVIEFSVTEKKGVKTLFDMIKKMFNLGEIINDFGAAVINERHKEALIKAYESLKSAVETVEGGLPVDMTSVDIENAISHLGEITGLTVSEEIVDRIFHEFCVGK